MTTRTHANTWRTVLAAAGLLAALYTHPGALPGTVRAEGLSDGRADAGAVPGAGLVHPAAGTGHPAPPGRVDPLPGIFHRIWEASQEFGVPADFLVCVARRESGLNSRAVGDGGRAAGLFQFHSGTFRLAARLAGYPEAVAREPRWRADVTVSTRAAAALMARPRGRWHWSVTPLCGRYWR